MDRRAPGGSACSGPGAVVVSWGWGGWGVRPLTRNGSCPPDGEVGLENKCVSPEVHTLLKRELYFKVFVLCHCVGFLLQVH